MRSMRRSLCAAILSLQAVVLFLTTPVMASLSEVSTGVALGVGLGLSLACLVVVGLLRRPWGFWAGWVVQAAAIALGFVVPADVAFRTSVIGLGVVFAALWSAAYLLGGRVDRDRTATTSAAGA
jgi:uncharacterized protein DUF4233